MGGGKQREIQYIQPPTYQAPPPPSAADQAFQQQQREQASGISSAYQSNLAAMKAQYEQQSASSAGVLKTLQDSMAAQQESAIQTRRQLDEASAASKSQLELLSASRNKAQGMTTDANAQATNDAGSALGTLSRRRAARRTLY